MKYVITIERAEEAENARYKTNTVYSQVIEDIKLTELIVFINTPREELISE